MMNAVMPIKTGESRRACCNAFFFERIDRTMNLNIRNEIIRLKRGEMIQLKATARSLPQFTTENPPATMPKPIMAPTIEWVVDTGSDFKVEKLTHSAAARSAEREPISARWGSVRISVDTIPLRIVSVTWEPMKVAPTMLRIPAITMACRRVIALAPTDEAMELATSLAPMFQAM